MGEKVRIPFKFHVKSVRWVSAEEAAEIAGAGGLQLGPHDERLGVEIEWHNPAQIEHLERDFRRKHKAERAAAIDRAQLRHALANSAILPRDIPPGTPALLRALYQNILPPRQASAAPSDDVTQDDPANPAPLSAPSRFRSLYRNIRREQPAPDLVGDDPTDATAPSTAANDDGLNLFVSINPLPHPSTVSTRGLVAYASNNRDAVSDASAGGAASDSFVQPALDTRGQGTFAIETVAATEPIIGPDPNGVVPGGPWTVAQGQPEGAFYGPKQPDRMMAQWVPPENEGGPIGSTGYWKTKTPSTPWRRFDRSGSPITPEEAHPNPPPPPAEQAPPKLPSFPAESPPIGAAPEDPAPFIEDIPIIP